MSNRKRSLLLQSKVSLTLVLLIATFVLVSYTVLQSVIAPAFDDLEFDAARSDLHRAEAALGAELENLDAISADWALWDDIHAYISGNNPTFRKTNLERPTLDNLSLDLMVVYQTGGRLDWSKVLVDGKDVLIEELEILQPMHPNSAGLTSQRDLGKRTLGFVQTGRGPMIISSRPILHSDKSGPIAGTLVMGQFLGEARLARLIERTGVNLMWRSVADGVDSSADSMFETLPDVVVARKTLYDINKRPMLVLTTQTKRDISSLGAHTIKVATLFLIIAGVLVCGFIWFMLRYTVMKPIEHLSSHIADIRTSGDLSQKITLDRGDEIGDLGREFNDMTGDLVSARRALLEQSFNAGKADTAAEVMHNIRNAMTPVINGVDRLRKSFKVTEKLRVEEATQQIAEAGCPDERKGKLLKYINSSFDHIVAVGNEALADLDMVAAQVKQVEGILSDQQRFANVAPVAEEFPIDQLIDEAANVLPREEMHAVELEFGADLSRLRVRAHRIGLLQVMGNLILNSYESIKRNETQGGKISLAAADEFLENQAMVRVTVSDNGSGFDKETEASIFRRGFTSKTESHTNGLGLHWCANAVASMGGRISAESAGNGRGAIFHVLLPAAQGGQS